MTISDAGAQTGSLASWKTNTEKSVIKLAKLKPGGPPKDGIPSIDNPNFALASNKATIESHKEILHIRHHSLFTPRDFDVSPYFQIVKPSIKQGFDPHQLRWADRRS